MGGALGRLQRKATRGLRKGLSGAEGRGDRLLGGRGAGGKGGLGGWG